MQICHPKIRIAATITLMCSVILVAKELNAQTNQGKSTDRVFEFDELEIKRVESARQYLPFLNVDSLHCGIYCLNAGAKDGQQPHSQDEIYYVESGIAKINIEGNDVDLKKGSIVFVPAEAKHYFHSITEDLKTLVFFSKGPVANSGDGKTGEIDKRLNTSVMSALTFHATFDSVPDANLFDTHGLIVTADSAARRTLEAGGNVSGVTIAKGAGVSGDCLRFSEKTKRVLFYKSKEAADFSPRSDWQGSISFWLKLDPNKDLGDGFCDPIQIAGRKWNDGSIWVDFDNVKPRTFRLGVFSDLNVWNPTGIPWDQFPEHNKPMVTVIDPPFSSEKWTHVVVTFKDINSTATRRSSAKLYLDGKLQGVIDQPIEISWDEAVDPQSAIMLGLNYVGDFDELRVFNRSLNQDEIGWLNRSAGK